jgi:hypothetical protein
MQNLDRAPRIFEALARPALGPIGQSDNERYSGLDSGQSGNYERENYVNPSEEDILIFAEEINILRYTHGIGEKMDTHIDVATGPNLYPLLASLPYFAKIIAVEFAPGSDVPVLFAGVAKLHKPEVLVRVDE